MSHVKQFQSISMSKSMRGLCKEEDYAFLGMSGSTTHDTTEGLVALEDDQKDEKKEKVRRQLEWERQEKDRLRAIEESKKEKEQQWRAHIAEVTSSQEKVLQDRLARLRSFREFQKKVLEEEEGMEDKAAGQLLTRV
ncbi:uncharacterized protein FYW49_019512 [Xenentodon cancila]